MAIYRAALIGCSRMGAFIDNEGSEKRGFAYSHAAGYEASSRTELIALSDTRAEVMARAGERYGVPGDHQYRDYREMLAREKPDIVSVATQPEHRTRIVLDAVEAGVPAIYAEKAMAASMGEADAMMAACEERGVFFNLGTNRRWDVRWEKLREMGGSGGLGSLNAVVSHWTGTLFNSASHMFDLMLWLHGDCPVEWVQGFLRDPDEGLFDGDLLTEDPVGEGIFRFSDGAYGYALNTSHGLRFELVCEKGTVLGQEPENLWEVATTREVGGRSRVERTSMDLAAASSTQAIIEDLAHSLDTGEPPRGGVRSAHQSTELIFAFIESHLQGGKRIDLPLQGSRVRLARDRQPRLPKFEPVWK